MPVSADHPQLAQIFAVPLLFHQMEEYEAVTGPLTRFFLECEQQPERYRNAIRRDTQKGALFESSFDLFRWEQPEVARLAAYCDQQLRAAVLRTSTYEPADLDRFTIDYHSWFHVTRRGGYQGTHNHPNASWSGIFCIDPGDPVEDRPESGAVRFHDPRTNADYYADPGNTALRLSMGMGTFQIAHEPGKLWMFPSYLRHEVLPYEGDRPRIVVAFNAWLGLKR